MRKVHWCMIAALLVLAITFAVTAKDKDTDPVVIGPDIYQKVFENERIRLLEVTFEPGATISMHSHPDHAAYVLEAGTLRLTHAEGEPVEFEGKVGQTFWIPAESHATENIGKTRVKVLVIELKEPASSSALKTDSKQ